MAKYRILAISLIVVLLVILAGCNPLAEYQLTTSVAPSGSGTISPGSGTYRGGTDVGLVATPAKYYKFNGWAGDISDDTDRITIKMNSDKNIVASFTKILYNLQVSVDNPDGGTVDPNSGDYEAGNQIKITATPAQGYRFDHWGGSVTGSANQVNILMDTNKNAIAYFIKQYILKITSSPSNGGTIDIGNGVYDEGAKVRLVATQIFPYAFSTWSGTDNDAVSPTTVTMDSDKSVICNFIKLTPGEWKVEQGPVYRGGTASVSIELNQYEYVEGEILQSAFRIYIQDPTGTTIKDFGNIQQANFLITAQIPGRYNIVMQYDGNAPSVSADYIIKYRIYRR